MLRCAPSILLILILLHSCKKSDLSGTHSTLTGEWVWFSGYDDNGSTGLKLVLKEEGKFKLYKDSKLLEKGRLLLENGCMTFHSDAVFKYKYYEKRNVVLFNKDTIMITRLNSYDQPVSYFKRN